MKSSFYSDLYRKHHPEQLCSFTVLGTSQEYLQAEHFPWRQDQWELHPSFIPW